MTAVVYGRVHPAVLRVAYALQRAGFRLPSIYRPCGRASGHMAGKAIDVATMVYQRGGYEGRLTRAVLNIARSTAPDENWTAIAEDDHIHLELTPGLDAIGRKTETSHNRLEMVHDSTVHVPRGR